MTTRTRPPDSPEESERRHFDACTREHEMTVLRDDGVYRHLRFQKPGSWIYGYDLITWPGHLAISGDIGCYVFSRIEDMFDFFVDRGYGINPHYWGEKLRAPRGEDRAKRYSHDVLCDHLRGWARVFAEDEDIYPDLLVGALDREFLDDPWGEWHTDSHDSARRLLNAIEHEMDLADVFAHAWEWDLREWEGGFLFCLWAIVRGIETYKAAMRTAVTA